MLPRDAGCESLDDIAKDHVTHTDRRADGSGQNKVDTDDRQHGGSLGNEIPLHVWNTHECNNCTVTFGTSLVQLPLGQAPKREMTPLIVYRCRLLEGRRDRVNDCNGDLSTVILHTVLDHDGKRHDARAHSASDSLYLHGGCSGTGPIFFGCTLTWH